MTLRELAHMRRLGAIPAMPLVLTDDPDVHQFCATNDLPVFWLPSLQYDDDLLPLIGLDLWIVGVMTADTRERIKQARPYSTWRVASRFGFAHRVNSTIGREVMQCR